MSFISNRTGVLVTALLLAAVGLSPSKAASSSSDYSILNNAFLSAGGESSSEAYTADFSAGDLGSSNQSTNSDYSISPGTTGQFSQPPVISGLADTTADAGPSAVQSFTVSDVDSIASAVRLTASSSDSVLVPSAGIVLGEAGTTHTIQVFPARGLSGSSVISVEAMDDEGLKSSATFTVIVTGTTKIFPVLTWAAPASITYGKALGAIQLNATADVPGVFTYNPPAGTILTAGQSRTLSAVFTPTDQDTYANASASTSITVNQAVLTISANNQTKLYGAVVPSLSASYGGFVNGESASVLDTPVSLNTTATEASKVGSYVIIPSGASAANYSIKFVNGTLAIQRAPLVIRANDLSKHLDEALPALTASYSGLVNGDTPASLSSPPSLTTAATAGSPAGAYPINVSGAVGANYDITFVSGTLTVLNINDPPAISEVGDQVLNEDTVSAEITFTISDFETAPAQLRVSIQSSNPNLIGSTGMVLGGTGASRTLTLTPLPNAFGTADLTLTVRDTRSAEAVRKFKLTVNPVNDAPTANGQSMTVIQNVPKSLTLTGNDAENDALTFTVASQPAKGVLIGSPPNLSYVPDHDATGPDSFTFIVHDGLADSVPATVAIMVTLAPDPIQIGPVADQTSAEDTELDVDFSVAIVGPIVGNLNISAHSSNPALVSDGNLSVGIKDGLRYLAVKPASNQSGQATITLTASDDSNHTSSRSFLLTVTPVNDPPVAANQTISLLEDHSQSITLGGTDVENNPLTFKIVAPPAKGSLSGTAPSLIYTPLPNANGSDSFTYTVNDGSIDSLPATVLLNIAPVNDSPAFDPIADRAVLENSGEVAIVLTGVSAGPADEAQVLSFSASSSNPGLSGTPTIDFDPSNHSWTLRFTPPTDATGPATVTVTLRDDGGTDSGGVNTITRSFNVTVTHVNRVPSISAINDQTIDEDGSTGAIALQVSDLETAAGQLTITGQSSNPGLIDSAHIAVSGTGANRSVRLTPLPNQFGTATITLLVRDADGGESPRNFNLNVRSINDSPTISALLDQSMDEDTTSGLIPFTVADVETAADQLTVSGQSSNPTLIDSAHIALTGSGSTRTVALTPLPNQFGTATITLTVRDADAGQSSWTFKLTVRPVNDAPILAQIPNQVVDEGTPLIVNLSASNIESASETLTFSFDSSPPPGATINSSSGIFTWTPAETQGPSTYSISVRVTDNGTPPLSATRTFFVQVNEVNTKPRLEAVGNRNVTVGGSLKFNLIATDDDLPGNVLTYKLESGGSTGASVSSGGLFSWTPNETQVPGTYTFTVSVSDNGSPALSDQKSFSVTVVGINTPPTLAPIPNQTIAEGNLMALTAIASDSDSPPQALTFSLGAGAPAGMGIDPRTGLITWIPSAAQGPSTNLVTVVVRDNGPGNLSSSQNFRVVVTEASGPIVISQARWETDGFHFKLIVPVGLQARIQASTNFIDWVEITRNPLVGTVDFRDPDSLTSQVRFYRALFSN
jgi:hypothetical protein